jgi:hypothetical protein
MSTRHEKIELPAHVLQGIKESIEQADRGQFISFDQVKKEMKVLLKKTRSVKN